MLKSRLYRASVDCAYSCFGSTVAAPATACNVKTIAQRNAKRRHMIPFRDNIPSRSFPIINIAIILANVFVFFYELAQGRHLERFIMHHGVVPAAVFAWPQSNLPVSAIALPFLT